MLLLIHNILETIQYTHVCLDFIILAQYILYDEEMLNYIDYTLYRLEKTKLLFEQYWPINSKQC